MAKNTYGGESNAKKVARCHVWETFAKYVSEERSGELSAATASVAVLSGPEGRDVETAVAYGFSPQNIWAIDIDKAALDSARERLGEQGEGVHWVNAALEDVVEDASFDIIFLDSCGLVMNVTRTAITRLLRTSGRTHKMPPTQFDLQCTVLGVGGMYGRDGALLKQSQRRKSRRKDTSAARKRFSVFHRQCVDVAAANFGHWVSHCGISYVSHRKERKGVPMLYAVGYLMKHEIAVNDAVLKSRRNRRFLKARSKRVQQNVAGKVSFLELGSDVDGVKLRKFACLLLEKKGDTAQVAAQLGIPVGQVRVWKAHLTRGTYGGPIDPKTIGKRIS